MSAEIDLAARLMDENLRLRAALIEMGAVVQGVDLPQHGAADSDHVEAQVRSGERWTAIEMLKVAARDKVTYLSAATRWAVAGIVHLEEKLAETEKRLTEAGRDLATAREVSEFNAGVIESEREARRKQANDRLREMEAWRAVAMCRGALLDGAKGTSRSKAEATIASAIAWLTKGVAPIAAKE